MSTQGYDRLAGCYRLLETLAFGCALERARFQHFDCLRDRKRILLLGDGDGRGLELACRIAPFAQIHSLDSSAGMLARSARRLNPADRPRVAFIQADALTCAFEPEAYDAVTTLFFLDCFSSEQVGSLVKRLRPALGPDALWLHADFALPHTGWARLRAQAWLAVMFAFFRWQTGLAARALPISEPQIEAAGFHRVVRASWQHGFLVSSVYSSGLPSATAPVALEGNDST